MYWLSVLTGNEVLQVTAFLGALMSLVDLIPLGDAAGKTLLGVWRPRRTGIRTPSRSSRMELACWHIGTGMSAALFACLAVSDLLYR